MLLAILLLLAFVPIAILFRDSVPTAPVKAFLPIAIVPVLVALDWPPIAILSVPVDCAPLIVLPPIATEPLPEAVTAFAIGKTFPEADPVAVPPNATAFCPVD